MAPDRPDAREPVRELSRRPHYAWIVAAAAFVALLIASGVRATPTILIAPLDEEFGWRVDQVSLAISINLVLFGLMAPFSAALMERFGVRRVVAAALAATAAGTAATIGMSALWQLTLLWGVVIGAATGCLSSPLAAVVATRWFVERRGLVTGVLSAAYATGQLIFLPVLAVLVRDGGWRWASAAVAISAAAAVPVALALLRERPADLGLPPYGAERIEPPVAAGGNPFAATAAGLVVGLRSRAFWLLAGTFFICGATTVGVIGTHLIPAAHDHGIGEVQAAGLLAAIGVFDILGVTASGWLTDRWDARQLLFAFYALRGLSLFFLPFTLGVERRRAGRLRGGVRARLGRHGAPDRRPDRRGLRTRARGRGLRLDLRGPPARRGRGRVGRRRRAQRGRELRDRVHGRRPARRGRRLPGAGHHEPRPPGGRPRPCRCDA